MKKIMGLLLLSGIVCIAKPIKLSKRIFLPSHLQVQNGTLFDTTKQAAVSLVPTSTIFAYDYHDVLVKRNTKARVWNMMSFQGLKLLGKRAFSSNFNRILERGCSGQAYVDHYQTKDPVFAEFMGKMSNAYRLKKSMRTIVGKLAGAGYELVIASDIGPEFYATAQQHPSISTVLTHFGKAQVVSYQGHDYFDGDRNLSITAVKKPYTQFYTTFQQRFNTRGKYVIFVDDKSHNAQAATKAGMIGIQYTGHKKFISDLRELGIVGI